MGCAETTLLRVFTELAFCPIAVAVRSKAWVCSRLLGLRVRISPGAWMSVSCDCFVLSRRVVWDGPIPRPEESYQVCVRECVCACVCVCVCVSLTLSCASIIPNNYDDYVQKVRTKKKERKVSHLNNLHNTLPCRQSPSLFTLSLVQTPFMLAPR